MKKITIGLCQTTLSPFIIILGYYILSSFKVSESAMIFASIMGGCSREFYDKEIKEDSTIGSVQLMQEYAKEAIKKIIKEYHTYNTNAILKGGKSKTMQEIALDFIKKNF